MMKSLLITAIILIIVTSCTSKRYILNDLSEERNYLNSFIKEKSKKGDISKKPMIIIDCIPYRYNYELRNLQLPITYNDIGKIDILDNYTALNLYGKYSKNGVIVIETESFNNNRIEYPVDENNDDVVSKLIPYIEQGRLLIILNPQFHSITSEYRNQVLFSEYNNIDISQDKVFNIYGGEPIQMDEFHKIPVEEIAKIDILSNISFVRLATLNVYDIIMFIELKN